MEGGRLFVRRCVGNIVFNGASIRYERVAPLESVCVLSGIDHIIHTAFICAEYVQSVFFTFLVEESRTLLSDLSIEYGVRYAAVEVVPMAIADLECNITVVYGHSIHDVV